MRIRFFNTYEPVSSFYRDIIPMLAAEGIESEIVISAAEYRVGRSLEESLGNIPSLSVIKTANFGLHAHQGFVAKAIVTILYVIQSSLYALFGPSTDVNLFLSQPPLIPLLGLVLARIRKQPYYCVVMDIQPQMAVALGLAVDDSLMTRILTKLSLLGLNQAQGVIAIGRCMQHMLQKMGIDQQRIHYIPNWVNENEIQPVSLAGNPVRCEMDWEDNFVVMYAGNLGLPQYFDDILQVAEELLHEPTSRAIRFVFIGTGGKEAFLRAQVAERGLTNVQILPFLHTIHSLSDILGAAHIHFVTLRESCTGLAVPSKTYSAMAAGRPIVYQGGAESEVAQMMGEEEIGVWVRPGDPCALRSTILHYAAVPSLVEIHGGNARSLIETTYNRKRSLRMYLAILIGEKQAGDKNKRYNTMAL